MPALWATGPRAPRLRPPLSTGPLGPGQRGRGLGRLGNPEAGPPGAKGRWGGPAASPGGRGKCYFCLLLSSGTSCWGGGGQRRPLRLGPAHREFLKDARGCWEGGRRGRGVWAGPPNPPPGAGPAGEGGGSRSVWPLRSRPGEDAGGRAGPGASPPRGQAARPRAPCCGRPPGWPARGIEAALFPPWARPGVGAASTPARLSGGPPEQAPSSRCPQRPRRPG